MTAKTTGYRLRLDPIKKRVWEAAAEAEKLTMAAFLTKAADAAADTVHRGARRYLTSDELDALDAAREQLRRAGVNLNVLLRMVHLFEDGAVDRLPELSELQTLREQLGDALAQILAMLEAKA